MVLLPLFLLFLPPVILFFLDNNWLILLFPAILILILAFSLRGSWFTPTFDFHNNCYYCDKRKPRYGDLTTLRDYISFSKIAGIQLLSKVVHGSKGRSWTAYEINLVLKEDHSRIYVVSCRNFQKCSDWAAEIAKKLNIPLVKHTDKKAYSKPAPLWVGILFLVIFGGTGSLLIIFTTVLPAIKNHQAKSWIKTPATVISSRVLSEKRRSKNGSYTVYKAVVTYNYTFKNRVYTGKNYSMFSDFTRSSSSQRKIVRNNPPGRRIICFVDPAAPQHAVISTEISSWELTTNILPPFIFIIAGGVVFFTVLRQKKR